MIRHEPIMLDEEVAIAREGYRFAQQHADNPVQYVNACPYGLAVPRNGNVRAHAWYRGWWFYHYVAKRWQEISG